VSETKTGPGRPRDLVDVNRAAKILRVHWTTVFRWIRGGKLRGWSRLPPGAKRPRYFVSRADLRAIWSPTIAPDEVETTAEENARLEAAIKNVIGEKSG